MRTVYVHVRDRGLISSLQGIRKTCFGHDNQRGHCKTATVGNREAKLDVASVKIGTNHGCWVLSQSAACSEKVIYTDTGLPIRLISDN